MRSWGRIRNPDGTYSGWIKVETDSGGEDGWVWLTTLCQTLLLNLGESPFFANYGLPAKPTIVQQVQPDFYITRTQQQFAQYFANLIIAKQSSDPPTYKINVTMRNGTKRSVTVGIPQ
jgi:hypothetical protein